MAESLCGDRSDLQPALSTAITPWRPAQSPKTERGPTAGAPATIWLDRPGRGERTSVCRLTLLSRGAQISGCHIVTERLL